MTEEPAPRAPRAPQATQSPAPARGEGPGPGRPPQGDTAPVRWNVCPDCLGRHRDGAACHDEQPTGGKTEQCGASSRIGFHYLVPYIGPCVLRHDHDGPVHEDANGTQWTDPRPAKAGDLAVLCPEQPPTGDLSERLDAALRTVGLARNLAAYRDAVLPVIEEALAEHMDERGAEQIERIQAERHALPKDERVRLDAADAPMLRIQLAVMARRVAETKAELERTSTAAALEIWHKLGMDASLHWKERAENAEDRLRKAEQAYMQLAEHHTDIKEHVAATQSRFAQIEKLIAAAQQRADQADAALQRVQDALAPSPEGAAFAIHTGGAGETTVQVVVPRDAIRAALDTDQPKEETQHAGNGNAEDCPVCRPLIDQPGGVLYPWLCTAADQPKETP